MSKTLLFAGKDSPEEFVKILNDAGYNVALATSAESDINTIENAVSLKWNRSSPISARSVIVETENAYGSIDTTILYFDATVFSSRLTSCEVEDISRALDTLVAGFQYLAVETFARYAQKKSDGRLVFLLKSQQTLLESMKASSQRTTSHPAGPIVASAQAAFSAFAENFAALAQEAEYGSVVLATGNVTNDMPSRDAEIATWLLGHLKSLDEKSNQRNKQSPVWAKMGTKSQGFLSMFR